MATPAHRGAMKLGREAGESGCATSAVWPPAGSRRVKWGDWPAQRNPSLTPLADVIAAGPPGWTLGDVRPTPRSWRYERSGAALRYVHTHPSRERAKETEIEIKTDRGIEESSFNKKQVMQEIIHVCHCFARQCIILRSMEEFSSKRNSGSNTRNSRTPVGITA